MSDDWNQHWRSYSASNTLNPAQTYRQRLIFDALDLEHAPGPVRLLDIGCGNGALLAAAAERRPDCSLVGLDLSEHACRLANAKLPHGHFFTQNIADGLTTPAQFDGFATHAVCTEVLEHLDAPVEALKRVRKLLAPKAKLVITVPGGPMSAFDKHIGHRGHFSRERLTQVLRDAGFSADVAGAGLPFFNLYRLMVVARGEKLFNDVEGERQELPLSARVAMKTFDRLFQLNLGRGRFGWQLVAVATP